VPPGPSSGQTTEVKPVAPAVDPALLALLQEQEQALKDFAAWPRLLSRFDDFISVARAAEVLTLAQQKRDECVAQMKRRAAQELARLRTAAGADPVAQLRALDEFPRPLQTLEELGDLRRTIREERDRLQERLDLRYLEDEAKLDKLRAAGDLAGARKLVAEMLRYAESLAHAREPRLQRLRRLHETELPQLERDASDRVVQKYVPVRTRAADLLFKRDHAPAYAEVVRFLKATTDAQVRVAGINYDLLLSVVPDALLSDRQLADIRFELGAALQGAPDQLPYRILTDLQDASDFEWLVRQTGAGLKRLAKESREIRMETWGAPGRIGFGPQGLQFVPKSGTPRAIVVRDLHPADLVTLAAAAEGDKPVDEVLRNDGALARSGGVAYLYSKVPERWVKAEALLREGERLRRTAPLFRLEKIRDLGHREARETLAKSRADAAAGKVEPARQKMQELAAQWAHDADLSLEIASALAAVMGSELKRVQQLQDWGKVKAVARQLFQSHASHYESPAVLASYGEALLKTGSWQTLAPLLTGDAWTWDNRAQGAPAPAVEDRGTGAGLRLSAQRPILVNPSRGRGASGLTVKLRVNEANKPFSCGILFDQSADGRARKLVVRAPGEVMLLASGPQGEEIVKQARLDGKLAAGQWVTLAWVAEGGDLVCLAERRPLFALRANISPDRGIGLISDVDANFRDIELRK
jgi:hypothetical protein